MAVNNTTTTTTSLQNAQSAANETIANLAAFSKISSDLSTATTAFQLVTKAHNMMSEAATGIKNGVRIG